MPGAGIGTGWRLPIATAAVVLLAACGHDVDPAPDYADPDAIPVVENFQALVQFNQVNLTWDSAPEIFAVIDGWYLERAVVDAGEPGEFLRLNRELHLEQVFADPFVENGVTYEYRILSVSPAGVLSRPVSTRVTIDFEPPAPPAAVRAAEIAVPEGRNFARVDWDASVATDVQFYRVRRLPPLPNLSFVEFPATVRIFDDISVEPLIEYRYTVSAVDFSGNEGVESAAAVVAMGSGS